jgi:hypothetical protein
MPRINSVKFSEEGWLLIDESRDQRVWRDPHGDVLSLHYDKKPPDLGGPLSHMNRIRDACRVAVVSAGGALVEVEPDEIVGLPVVRTILKFPQDPHGMSYLGVWTIPRARFRFEIRALCSEHEPTGLRDAAVWGTTQPELDEDSDDPYPGWFQDPYDPFHAAPILRNKSDDEVWDAEFPDHPLSRARRHLRSVKSSLTLDAEVRDSEAFA